MSNPLIHIDQARGEIAQRKKRREAIQLEHRGALAAEEIADEVWMLRAEMSVMRELIFPRKVDGFRRLLAPSRSGRDIRWRNGALFGCKSPR